jgi:hypothetical protein
MPEDQNTPIQHTFSRSITVPDDMLTYLSEYLYPQYVQKTEAELPPRDTPYSLEEMRKPNPQSRLEWMQDWFDENMVALFIQRMETEIRTQTREAIELYTAQANAQAQLVIDQKRAEIKALIVRG